MSRRHAFCAIAVLVAAMHPVAARAATVAVVPDPNVAGRALSFAAAAGEVNDVVVSAGLDALVVTDRGAVLSAGQGCIADDPQRVRCPSPESMRLIATLGDGDDRLAIDALAYALLRDAGFGRGQTVHGEAGDDTLAGGPGHDTLSGGLGADTVDGGDGDDELLESGAPFAPDVDDFGPDVIRGGAGQDWMTGSRGPDMLDGGADADQLWGQEGDDLLLGGEGRDSVLFGGPGDDVLDGGPGDDLGLYGSEGDDVVRGGDGNDVLDMIPGDTGIDDLFSVGADTLEGGPGDDVLAGGAEAATPPRDVIAGGGGTDTVDYAARTSSLQIRLDAPGGDGAAGENDDVRPDIERIVAGSGGDTLVGADGGETFEGGLGDDVLAGGGGGDTLLGGLSDEGSDTLDGGAGNDVLRGGPGEDALDGGAGDDLLAAGGGADTGAGGDGSDDISGGPGADLVGGGPGPDTLRGGDAVLVGADRDDVLDGGPGDDRLLGGPGDDTLDGGAGADRLSGEGGRDTVTYAQRTAPVRAALDGPAGDGEAGEGDTIAADVEGVVAGDADDTLSGDPHANSLAGGRGDDELEGGRGEDRLEGDLGTDVLRARDGARDVVSCGRDLDLAIADRADIVRDCEIVDRGGPRRRLPIAGVELAPRSGVVRVLAPGFLHPFVLREDVLLPLGTTVQAEAGVVRLAVAGRRRTRRSASLRGGSFRVLRGERARRIVELELQGPGAGACRTRRLVGRAGRRRPLLRVRGRYGSALVDARRWSVEDRCDGTLFRIGARRRLIVAPRGAA